MSKEPRAAAGLGQFTPLQIAQLYDFPANLDGTGECIAIIELSGGFNTSDLNAYFSSLGLTAPSVTSVSVDKGSNSPTGNADGPDSEVMLDIEISGAIAPKAKIVVYFTANTAQGFLDAITHAVHDTVNKPSIISISWGGARVELDGAGFPAIRPGVSGCGGFGNHGVCRRG